MAAKKGLSRRQFMAGAGLLGGALALGRVPGRIAAAPSPRAKPAVAIGACPGYGPAAVEAVLRDLLSRLGGLGDVVRPGATVVIKANLTGGGKTLPPDGSPPILTYVTHPDVVRAIALLAREAGAARVLLAESYAADVWELNGYGPAMAELGLELLNLASPAPQSWYTRVPVAAPLVWSAVWMNAALAAADVYISVSKMKCHADAGITLSMKNSVGYLPMELYRVKESDRRRTLVHAGNYAERLPGILADLAQARPIDFCVIDGVSTLEQGEGPWNEGQAGISLRTVRPQVLIAGRNPVAVDAVGCACMGFDPQARPFTGGFLSGWNYLSLAAGAGLGPNDLEQIDVLGLPLAQAVYPFRPCPNQSGITPTPEPTARPTETPAVRRTWLPLIERRRE